MSPPGRPGCFHPQVGPPAPGLGPPERLGAFGAGLALLALLLGCTPTPRPAEVRPPATSVVPPELNPAASPLPSPSPRVFGPVPSPVASPAASPAVSPVPGPSPSPAP